MKERTTQEFIRDLIIVVLVPIIALLALVTASRVNELAHAELSQPPYQTQGQVFLMYVEPTLQEVDTLQTVLYNIYMNMKAAPPQGDWSPSDIDAWYQRHLSTLQDIECRIAPNQCN